MLERALTQPQQCSVDPLDNAFNWGIPIWTTDKLKAWLDKIYASIKDNNTLKSVNRITAQKDLKVKEFKKSFIKFESYKRDTRPVFLELSVWPTINFDSEVGSCPFETKPREQKVEERSDKLKNKNKSKEMTRKPRANATRARRSEQLVAGYCEICRSDYKDLTKHVQSDKHLAFVRNDDNFLSLDTLINAGANVEAFLKLNQPDDVEKDLFSNGKDNLDDVISNEKINKSTKSEISDYDLKMVQCNGDRRKLSLKYNSSHNLRTRIKHESGHLLRSKGSPWHESEKSDKFFDRLEGYTIKKRAKGTIWIEEDDPSDKCSDDEKSDKESKAPIVEKNPLSELNDGRLKNKECYEQTPKKNQQLSRIEDRKEKKKGSVLCEQKSISENVKDKDNPSGELIPQKRSEYNSRLSLNEDKKSPSKEILVNGALKSLVSPAQKLNKVETVETHEDTRKNVDDLDKSETEENDGEKSTKVNQPKECEAKEIKEKPRYNRGNKRNVRSRARQRLSVEERLIEDNRAYYKVEVLGNKLRSSVAHVSNNQSLPVKEVEKEKEVKKDDGPSSEKPVVVRFKRVRKSELSLLSDEAESFMFGESRRDDWSNSSDWNNEKSNSSSSSILPNDTESEEDNTKASSSIISSPSRTATTNLLIKQELLDEDSQDSSHTGRARKRRRTQTEVLIKENTDYYKFETPGSRLRFQGLTTPQCKESEVHELKSLEKSPNKDQPEGENKIDSVTNTEEKLYPSKPSAEVEKMKFSFESVPKSEPWYQTYQRQDEGAEFWHSFSDSDAKKPFLLPYEIENFHENLLKICQKNEMKKKARSRGPNGLGRSPRKSPRCHASTLAIMSTIIRKREQQQQTVIPNVADEETRSGANTPKPDAKSSTDLEIREIARSIDEMLNVENNLDDSFESDVLDGNLQVLTESEPSGPPPNLIELLDSSYQQYFNGIENSSCASSECGEAVTESPLKRRKRRKNRTGWPGIRARKKMQKLPTIPDVDSERENVPAKTPNPEEEEDEDEDDEEEEEEEEEENVRNQQSILERLQAPSIVEAPDTSQDSRIKCKTNDFPENQVTNEVDAHSYESDDPLSKKSHQTNDENHENVFRQDMRITNNTRQQISSKLMTRKRQRESDARPSSSVSIDSHPEIKNHDHLYRQKPTSGIISRKNYSTGTLSKRRPRDGKETSTIEISEAESTTPLADGQQHRESPCKKKDCVSPKKQSKTRKRPRKSTSETSFDNENCKKDELEVDVECKLSERVSSDPVSGPELQQRRSSIEFQPVVRVMKIEDQVDMDHNILSVTVASNRRLRSSSSPKLTKSPPAKRYKRSKGPFGRWIKNS
ncbi:trichohyalin-like isoform X2 [Chelonus insularis]|nr:trichohyalin-like isoform X2 [Chelonus insularis]